MRPALSCVIGLDYGDAIEAGGCSHALGSFPTRESRFDRGFRFNTWSFVLSPSWTPAVCASTVTEDSQALEASRL